MHTISNSHKFYSTNKSEPKEKKYIQRETTRDTHFGIFGPRPLEVGQQREGGHIVPLGELRLGGLRPLPLRVRCIRVVGRLRGVGRLRALLCPTLALCHLEGHQMYMTRYFHNIGTFKGWINS